MTPADWEVISGLYVYGGFERKASRVGKDLLYFYITVREISATVFTDRRNRSMGDERRRGRHQ